MMRLFETLEMPLIPILADIEARGIMVSAEALQRLEKEIDGKLQKLTENIYKAAGQNLISTPRNN